MWLRVSSTPVGDDDDDDDDDGDGGGGGCVPLTSRGDTPDRLITRLSVRTARAWCQKESRLRVDWTAVLLAAPLALPSSCPPVCLSVCRPPCSSPPLWSLLSPLRQLTKKIRKLDRKINSDCKTRRRYFFKNAPSVYYNVIYVYLGKKCLNEQSLCFHDWINWINQPPGPQFPLRAACLFNYWNK